MGRRERDKALAALQDPVDFSTAVVEAAPRVKVVHSVRLDPQLSQRLEAEAQRRGITPSALLRDLVEHGLEPEGGDETVTVRLSDLRRALESAVRHAA